MANMAATIVVIMSNITSTMILYVIVTIFIIDSGELLLTKTLASPITWDVKNVMMSNTKKTLYENFLPSLNSSVASANTSRRFIIIIIRINVAYFIADVTTDMMDLLFSWASF